MGQLILFQYDQLKQDDRDFIQGRTNEIKALVKRTAQDIIDIGSMLIEVKDRLPHGMWGQWLDKEFGWGLTAAFRFTTVAVKFKSSNLEDLEMAPSALYLLAAPSTPDEARAEALERAIGGETITHKAAKEIVKAHKEDDLSEEIETETISTEDEPPSFNYKRDNKSNQIGDIYEPKGYDACQTPAYAIDPLLPYLKRGWTIWEPAAGENNLVEALYDSGYSSDQVDASDILTGQNFFEFSPERWDCLVTNPPYSIKYQWLERCYQLGKPFALLLPVETLGAKTAQELLKRYGFEMMLLNKRVDFKMPNKGWNSSAQFPVLWLCWQILPDRVMFGEINKDG